ncbi:5-formyltetrahydrofolate cyclo-ligase [Campylobacter sp.]|uniref:5-formyltetrahydrofolate cyclo-ligase n=1 Tax=Campylobacter sp. TaxID=205 RepID=UPI0026DAF3D0|nr:5-formyltetrahydrofolate cyclo-ligase [Campylobacter sp.]MDO4673742.1 5-formyltetrahydrofolate cyclo-ligase [Campylobacter sp.]
MQKELFRQEQKRRLKQNARLKFKKDFLILKDCLQLIKRMKARKILIFLPLYYEPNLVRFRRILSKNCELFVPLMQDKSLKIVKLRLPFSKKRFGVLEPNNSFLSVRLDVAIVPVIGVDCMMKRIGHGQGFYDRFFANLKQEPRIIFVQSIEALSEVKLTKSHDIAAKFYLSPHKKYFKKEKKNDSTHRTYRRFSRHWDRIFAR